MNDCCINVIPGQIYRHFKGKLYQIITVAIHSETGEKLVIYQKLYDDFRVHARPYDMFLSEVDHVKYPDVCQKYRFELISNINSNDANIKEESMRDVQIQHVNRQTMSDQTVETQEITTQETNLQNSAFQNVDKQNTAKEDVTVQNMIYDDSDNYKESESDEEQADPLLLKFLDADTFEEKRNILVSIKDKITDQLIDNIAASLDVTVDEGDIDKRFSSLLACVDTRSKFEINRFR